MANFKSKELESALQERLRQDETVLWTYENGRGTPFYVCMAKFGLLQSMLMLMVFLAFQLYFLLFFPLMPMLIVQSLMYFRRNRFAYAVTDQRVFVMNSLSPICVHVYRPRHIIGLMSYGTEACGTVTLNHFLLIWKLCFLPAKIANIPNAKQVEQLIRDNVLHPDNTTPPPPEPKTEYPDRKPNLFHGR